MTAGVLDPLIWNLAQAEAELNRLQAAWAQLSEDVGHAEAAVNDAREELNAKVKEHVEQAIRGASR